MMQVPTKVVVVLSVLACLALPASAGVKVEYEDGIDFESYRTYAWQAGTEAGQPQIQQAIYRAVEQELEARQSSPNSIPASFVVVVAVIDSLTPGGDINHLVALTDDFRQYRIGNGNRDIGRVLHD